MTTDVLARLRARPMNRFQVVTVVICFVLNMLDGFDVLAMAFVGPGIREDWHLAPDRLGLLLSAGLFGMAIGSIFISPLSDRFGRRPVIIICLIDMMLGMSLSAIAQNVPELLALRALTGLGLGGLLASMNTLVAEYSSDKRRDFAVSFMVIGYALGAALGGLVAVYLIETFGWRAVFVFGGTTAALMVPITFLWLPESLDLLLVRRGKNALAKVNAILKRLGEPAITELPPAPVAEKQSAGYFELFGPTLLRGTVLICAGFFMVFLANIFLVSWTPTLLRDLGMSNSGAVSGSLLMHVGAVLGGIVMGSLASKFGLRLLAPVFMLALFVTVMLFATLPGPLWLLLAISSGIGFFGNGASTSLYAIAPSVFPVRLRAAGTGLAIGFGRMAGILSPSVAGVLMAQGWPKPLYCFVICVPLLLSAILVPLIKQIRAKAPGREGKGVAAVAAHP